MGVESIRPWARSSLHGTALVKNLQRESNEGTMLTSPNIFTLSATPYGPEDRFTGHLAYLFHNVPAIGQEWLNHLRGGVKPDTFEDAGKHAAGNSQDMPDFLIVGAHEDVICEHKLGAPLGPTQLERYCSFAGKRDKPTRVAFVTGAVSEVPSCLLEEENYLRPCDGVLHYFRWEELYPIVSAHPERLAREFSGYMQQLGFRPCDTREWADLFTNAARVNDFAPQWAHTIDYFKKMGAKTVYHRVTVPAIQIKKARPWLSLLYLKPVPLPLTPTDAMLGPFISASVALDRSSPYWAAFSGPEVLLVDTPYRVLSRPVPDGPIAWCREYIASLDAVVSADPEVMRQKLLEFAQIVFNDAVSKGEGEIPATLWVGGSA